MTRDRWAEWLASRRFGGDPELKREFMHNLARTRDRVLDGAELAAGETLLDVGCGEGLIGFGALRRGAGRVIFSDVSEDLLGECEALARELGVIDRCRLVRAPGDNLGGIDDSSVDIVTTRAALIYIGDKRRALAEFHRVLRPGGRISIWEPINRFGMHEQRLGFAGYELNGLGEIGDKLRAVYEALQPPDSDPMLDFDERDLIRFAEDAGFFPLRLKLRARIVPTEPRPWETFLNRAWNPNIPTVREAVEQALTAEEWERLAAHLRPLVEAGRGTWRIAEAHLLGAKPDA